MALHLTPQLLEAVYELLRLTAPIKRWNLPHADVVEFHVTKHTDRSGDYVDGGECHVIRISSVYHSTLQSLTLTMAHEMCHLQQRRTAPREGVHGKEFKRLARLVCRHHGFDLKTF